MDVTTLKVDLSVRGKNGLPFLLSALFIWTIIAIIFLLPLDMKQKNICMLMSTGLMFPIALLMANIFKADWKFAGNSLGKLGLYINLAQFMYFPIVIWAFVNDPNHMLMFFAIITGAHLFPMGWLYDAKGYYVLAPIMSIAVMILGWTMAVSFGWIIAVAMICFIIVLIVWLLQDYKRKVAITKKSNVNHSVV